MAPESTWVVATNGIQLHLLDWGGSGTACVLVHGLGQSAHVWDDVAPVLRSDFRVLALDLRGHGDSDWDPSCRYDLNTLARDLEVVLDRLRLHRVVIAGHSLGGAMVSRFASSRPERVSRLSLIDVAAHSSAPGISRIVVDESAIPRRFNSTEQYAEGLAARYPLAQPRVISRLAQEGLRQQRDGSWVRKTDPAFCDSLLGGAKRRQRVSELEHGFWDELRRIPCPALVVRGIASSVLSQSVARRMAVEFLPRGELASISLAGHGVMLDNPEEFRETLYGFLTRRSQPRLA